MVNYQGKLYKVLIDGKSCHGGSLHGGSLAWSLPRGRTPGDWMPTIDAPRICESGYHLTTDPHQWLKVGVRCYEAEGRDEAARKEDKVCFQSARLLRHAPEMIPDWWRSAEKFIGGLPAVNWMGKEKPQGKVRPEWKVFATRDAAWAAAGAAAWAAAGAAARVAARDAAWAATRDAAWVAAGAAAWDAAWAATRDAAWVAAWDAARDAGLYARLLIVYDLEVDHKHRDHVEARMDVWRRGYGLCCAVNGVLYVYRAIASATASVARDQEDPERYDTAAD